MSWKYNQESDPQLKANWLTLQFLLLQEDILKESYT